MSYTNLDYLKDFTGNDENLMQEAVQRYLSNAPKLLKDLNDSIACKDWQKVAFSAHTLYSATQIVGIEAIKNNLKNIEQLAKKMDETKQIHSEIQYVNEAIEGSYQELREFKK